MANDDVKLHAIWVIGVLTVIVTLIVCITAYNIAELHAIKPQIIQKYTWPSGQ